MTARFKLQDVVLPEMSEGRLLMRWVNFEKVKRPELDVFFHIPNGGPRTPAAGAQLKRTGVRKGIPDYCLPMARDGYSALYIELKKVDGGVLSESQNECIAKLRKYGNKVVVANGWMAAKAAILKYLEVPDE